MSLTFFSKLFLCWKMSHFQLWLELWLLIDELSRDLYVMWYLIIVMILCLIDLLLLLLGVLIGVLNVVIVMLNIIEQLIYVFGCLVTLVLLLHNVCLLLFFLLICERSADSVLWSLDKCHCCSTFKNASVYILF